MKKRLLILLCSANIYSALSAAAENTPLLGHARAHTDAVDAIVARLNKAYVFRGLDMTNLLFNELSPTEKSIMVRWENNPYELLNMAAEAQMKAEEARKEGQVELAVYNQRYAEALDRLATMHARERR